MNSRIDISSFRMRSIKPGSVIVLLGKRGSGKTKMSLEILYHLRRYPIGMIMAGTPDTVEEYKRHVPDTLIYKEYEPSKVNDIIKKQEQLLEDICNEHPERDVEENKEELCPVFLILDDLMHDQGLINRDKAFKQLMLAGRHYKITLVICAQYVMNLAKCVRGQVDYVFTMYQSDPNQRRLIWENYNVGFPNVDVFHKLFWAGMIRRFLA